MVGKTSSLGVALIVSTFLAATPAHATLGGSEQSIHLDANALGGGAQVTAVASPRVLEIQTPGGVTVRQYLNANGKVFGIAWEGPLLPDLSRLLGPYYADFETEAKRPHASRHALRVQTQDIVVESAGRMRAMRGRAYLPALLPAGFNLETLR